MRNKEPTNEQSMNDIDIKIVNEIKKHNFEHWNLINISEYSWNQNKNLRISQRKDTSINVNKEYAKDMNIIALIRELMKHKFLKYIIYSIFMKQIFNHQNTFNLKSKKQSKNCQISLTNLFSNIYQRLKHLEKLIKMNNFAKR
jgi:hypothetical protein